MATTTKRPAVLTRTDVPPVGESRRTVLDNAREVMHRWASRQVREGRCGNVFFEDGVIFSYGRHFPIARWVKVKGGGVVVFFTTETPSSTTAKHKSFTRRAIPHGAEVFSVPDVLANTRDRHRANLAAYETRAAELLGKAKRSRRYAESYQREALRVITEGNRYAQVVGLRQRIGPPDGGDLDAYREQLEKEWAAADEKERASRARAEKERAKRVAAEMVEWRQRLAAWQAGGDHPGTCPDQSHQLAYLRVRGSRLETTMRAVVPLDAVLPVLAAIRGGTDLPAGYAIDGYGLQGIDRDRKVVTVGCHEVTFDEIERVAATIGK